MTTARHSHRRMAWTSPMVLDLARTIEAAQSGNGGMAADGGFPNSFRS